MKKFLRENIDVIVVALILAALLAIIFKDVIFSDYIFVKRDISRYYYPSRDFIANSLKMGKIPLWNPYLFCGTPLHAPIQNSIFYPLSLIYYLTDVATGFDLFIIVHILLCGIFMYIFMRSCKASTEGSFLAALAFTFSGYVMSAISLTIALCAITWFPLAMLLFLKGIRERHYKASAGLGAVITVMFLAGDPSVTLATFGIIFLASAWLFMERLIRERRADLFIIYNLLIASGVFLLLSAFQTLPAVEYYSRTVRASMSWTEASAWSVPYTDLFSLIIPYFNDLSCYYQHYWVRQSWLDNYYVGITTIMLAGFALRFGLRKRLVQFLLAIGLLSVAICLGRHFVLYPALYKILPIVRIIRYPVRFFFIFTFASCALAGIGYDYLKGMISSGGLKRLARIFLATAFASSLAAVAITVFSERIGLMVMHKAVELYQKNPSFNIWQFPSLIYADMFNLRRTFLYIACFGMFIFLWQRANRNKLISFGIFLLVGFDLMLTNTSYEPVVEEAYFKEPTPNISYVMEDKSLFRIYASPYSFDKFTNLYDGSYREGIKTTKDRFVNNRMMEFGLYDMWGYDSTVFDRSHKLVGYVYRSMFPTDTNLLDLLNVKYVSSHGKMRARGYRKVNETEYAAVYLNTRCLPRAMLLRRPIVIDNDEEILEYMSSKKFDPRKEIVLEEEISLPERLAPGSRKRIRKDRVDITMYAPEMVEISVAAKEPAFLLLSDTYYPGWKAYVDGKEVRIHRADFFLRAVQVPEGEHMVSFVFDPLSFKIGAAISIIAILLLLLYPVIKR